MLHGPNPLLHNVGLVLCQIHLLQNSQPILKNRNQCPEHSSSPDNDLLGDEGLIKKPESHAEKVMQHKKLI